MASARGSIAVLLAVALSAAPALAQQPPAPQAAPPPPVYPLGYTPWEGNQQSYGGAPTPVQLMAFEDGKKNPAVALLLEFVMAGVGSIYADHWQGALITWAGILGGVALVVVGASRYQWQLKEGSASQAQMQPDNSGAVIVMVAGALTMFGFRIYGLVDSWQSTNDYNRGLAKRLGMPLFSATVAPAPTERGLAWGPALQFRF
jgi:hypothetical protein